MREFGKHIATSLAIAVLLASGAASAQSNKKSVAKRPPQGNAAAVTPNAVKVNSNESEDGYVAASSTQIDFSETAIDGKMKAPEGFLLQGRQSSSLSQMVKLRSNFRNELNNSKSATKALVK
jgi:hypothetical protein